MAIVVSVCYYVVPLSDDIQGRQEVSGRSELEMLGNVGFFGFR
jgi:hypothetical protein